MAKQRSVFEEGAKDKGVDPTLAMKIFDLVEKFAATVLTNPTLQLMHW